MPCSVPLLPGVPHATATRCAQMASLVECVILLRASRANCISMKTVMVHVELLTTWLSNQKSRHVLLHACVTPAVPHPSATYHAVLIQEC